MLPAELVFNRDLFGDEFHCIFCNNRYAAIGTLFTGSVTRKRRSRTDLEQLIVEDPREGGLPIIIAL